MTDSPGPLTNTVTVTGTTSVSSHVISSVSEAVTIIDIIAPTISATPGELTLHWLHAGAGIERYEVWRSNTPYFSPVPPTATKLADVFSVPAWQAGDPISYTDDSSHVGDVGSNHFYLIRVIAGNTAVHSERAGEFDFAIQPGN